MEAGYSFSNLSSVPLSEAPSAPPPAYPHMNSGDMLESIHVSNVRSSPAKSDAPHLGHSRAGHFSVQGL